MPALVEEGVGGGLVVLDPHARERLEDPSHQDLQVAVVAVVVPGDDAAQPAIVLVVGGFPGLAVSQPEQGRDPRRRRRAPS